MNTFNTFRSLDERTMTEKEKAKEDRLKDKYDDSSMKKNMKDHYGKEEGEKVYYATIRKQAMKNEHHQKDADGKVIEHEDEAPGTPASVEEAAQPAGQVPDKRAEALKKRQSMIKKQVLMKKLQALRQGGGEDVVAHNELEGEMVEGVGDAIKKGVKRHKDAVEKKKIKNRKAVPYAALAAEHEPEGEVVSELKNSTLLSYSQKATNDLAFSGDGKKKAQKRAKGIKAATGKLAIRATDPDGSLGFNKNVRNEDYMSGQTGKIQKRTLAWMRKKGMKGAPGLDAMKAREAEHKARRGVKEEVEQIDELSKTTTANYLYHAKVDKNYVHSGKMGKYAKARDKGIKRAEKKLGKKVSDRVNYVADYDTRSMKQDSSKSEYPRKIKVKEEVGCETKKVENKGKKKIDPKKNPVVEGSAYGLWKGDGKRKLPGDKKKKQDVKEAKVDKGRSDYGKATIRNWRHSGPSTVEPAMFDPENKRGKTIEKRREEHKARRGVKGAKVPTYKKESFSDWRTELGEEGYDHWRDKQLERGTWKGGGGSSGGGGKKPKGKTVYQKEAEKKYGKGVTAVDVVKAQIRAKYGKGAIMEPKK